MSQRIRNAARTMLASSIGSGDTTLTIQIEQDGLFPLADTDTDAVGTPGKDWFKIVLEDVNHVIEICYVRTHAIGSGVFSNVLRGQEGTAASAFLATETVVGIRMTALDFQNAFDLSANLTEVGEALIYAASVDAQVQALGTGLQKQVATALATDGSGTAYTLTPTPAITAYVEFMAFDVSFHVASGDDPTIAISGVATPPNLVKQLIDGTYVNIKAGDIPEDHASRVRLVSATQALVERLPPPNVLIGQKLPDTLSAADPYDVGMLGSPIITRDANASFVLTDAGRTVRKSNANSTSYTWTIEPDATTNFPIGTVIALLHDGTAGNITVARGSGVLMAKGLVDSNQAISAGSDASIQKVAANRWRFRG